LRPTSGHGFKDEFIAGLIAGFTDELMDNFMDDDLPRASMTSTVGGRAESPMSWR
jgi:hypothetical protein